MRLGAENGRQRKFQSVNVKVRNRSEFIFVATTWARGRAVDNKILLQHVCKTVLGSDYFSPGVASSRKTSLCVSFFRRKSHNKPPDHYARCSAELVEMF